jgi:hypothetical protein
MMVSEIEPSARRNEKHTVQAAVATLKANWLTLTDSWDLQGMLNGGGGLRMVRVKYQPLVILAGRSLVFFAVSVRMCLLFFPDTD